MLGRGVSRARSVLTGTDRSLPNRTDTEYVVHEWGAVGLSVRVLGEAEAIVEVGVLLEGGVSALDPVELPEDTGVLGDGELVEAGAGDTIAGAAGGEDVVAVVDDELVAVDGLELSLGTPLANGLRAIRARRTLAGTVVVSGVADLPPAEVVVDALEAAGGTGTGGAPPA